MVKQMLKSRFTLINAPAGSGKTTSIKNYIDFISNNYENSFSLCLTFTNRAVDELKSKIYSNNVDIFTIHEYCNKILHSFYKTDIAKDVFCELFDNEITEILNSNEQGNVDKIDRYKTKYQIDMVTKDIVRINLSEIQYGQTNFTSYLTGKLSHDDLLRFVLRFSQKYPKFLDIISKKYKYIFIDEYQDTSSNILQLIYNACVRNKQYLVLFGDKMQEIYNNYDGNFDSELSHFDISKKLSINYRSSEEIVSVLNKIYNNNEYSQTSYRGVSGVKPYFVLVHDIMSAASQISNQYCNALQLYIANRERFEKIGVKNIFNAVTKIKDYQFGSKYQPTDVLLDNTSDNPDTIIKFCFDLQKILFYINSNNFGAALQEINGNKYFIKDNFIVKYPFDKRKVRSKLTRFKDILLGEYSILQVFNLLNNEGYLLLDDFKTILEREDYKELLNCNNLEFKKLYIYLADSHISTQHGVKGESHDEVIMFLENSKSSNPNVKMYEFLYLLVNTDIDFEDYKSFVGLMKQKFLQVTNIFKSSSDWNKMNYQINLGLLISLATELVERYKNNKYFIYTKKLEELNSFLTTKNIRNAQKAFSLSNIIGILNAYRLFYVGCSRARTKLILVIIEDELQCEKNIFMDKFKDLGFDEKILS